MKTASDPPGSPIYDPMVPNAPPRFPALLLAAILLVIAGLTSITLQWVRDYELRQARENLTAVADLKQRQIVDWLKLLGHTHDAVATEGLLAQAAEDWFQAGLPRVETGARIARRLNVIRTALRLRSIQLFDFDGTEVGRSGEDSRHPDRAELQRTKRQEGARISDIHLTSATNAEDAHIDVIGALRTQQDGQATPIAALVFHVDLSESLFPLIQYWPTRSATAESLLVRRDEDQVTYLNELRHRKGTTLKLHMPLSAATTAARAVLGETGPIEAVDYRGVQVLAESRAIAGTPWYLLVKQDASEIFQPVEKAAWIALSTTLGLATALSFLLWLWHARQVSFFELRMARAEARFGCLLRQANDIILLMNEHGVIVDASQQAIEAFGFPLDTLMGKSIRQLIVSTDPIPSDGRPFGDCCLSQEGPQELTLRRADGTLFPAESKGKFVESRGQRYLQAIIRDISERKAAEHKLRRLNDLYAALRQTSQAIAQIHDEPALLSEICRIAVEYTHASLACIAAPDRVTGTLKILASAGPESEYLNRVDWRIPSNGSDHEGIVGSSFRANLAVVCQDIDSEPRLSPWQGLWKAFNLRSGAALPLAHGSKTFGLYSSTPHYWDISLLKLLEAMARDISVALQRLESDGLRQQAEEALKTSELRFRTVADFTSDWEMWIGPDQRYQYVSPSCSNITGYPPAAFLENPKFLDTIVHPEDRQAIAEHDRIFEAPFRRNDAVTALEFRIIRRDGCIVWIEHTCRAVFDGSDHYSGRRISNRDITERKEREAELQRRESLYRAVVESQLDGFWLVDRTGRLLEVNEVYVRRSGYSRDELLSMRIADLEARETLEDTASHMNRIVHEGGDLFESLHRTKDGTNWMVEVNAFYLPLDGGLVCGFIRDLRQRKRAESLWQTRMQLAKTAETGTLDELMQASLDAAERLTGSRIGFFHFVDSNQEDLVLQAWSSKTLRDMCKADGKGAHYPVSQAGVWVDCFHSRAPVVHNDYASLPHRRGLPEGHAPVIRELTVPVVRQGLVVAVLGVGNKPTNYEESDVQLVSDLAELVMDMVGQKKAEQAFREGEERYRHIVTQANEGIWSMDAEHRTTFVNPAITQILGYSEAEMLGIPVEHFMFEEDLAGHRQRMVLRHAGQDAQYEHRFRRRDGSECWCRVSATVLKDEKGRFAGSCAFFTDISDQRLAAQKLQLAASVFASTQEGIIITDRNGKILDVNLAFTQSTGYSRDEVLGKNPSFLKSGRHPPDFYAGLWESVTETGSWSGEIWNRKKNGDIFPEWLTISSVRDANGETTSYIGAVSDISQLKNHEQQLEYLAYFDLLTGLPNRALLADRMHQAIGHSRRQQTLLLVAYLDLDGFKPVNDQFGHAIGDLLLIEVASRINSTLREGDTLARLGGDEFVLLLLGMERLEDCKSALQRILQQITDPWLLPEGNIQVSASIGVTVYPADDTDPDTLLRHADQAMYRAKRLGKNRFQLYDANVDDSEEIESDVLAPVHAALDNREFVLHYQPKIDLDSGLVVGAEALIRWNHPERGLVYPGDFLPLIANHPLIARLDRWVIAEGLRQMAEWAAAGLDLEISVNITAQTLQANNFIEDLKTLLATFPELPPGRFEFEILETAALEDMRYISTVIESCKQLGIRFALDDFGTGYSSLTYLRHLPAEVLKIDQSFVRDMLEDAGDLAIVQGVIGLCRAFGLSAVAEGVETRLHGAKLLELGCDLAQGYGIARPMPAKDIPGWIRDWELSSDWQRSMTPQGPAKPNALH